MQISNLMQISNSNFKVIWGLCCLLCRTHVVDVRGIGKNQSQVMFTWTATSCCHWKM